MKAIRSAVEQTSLPNNAQFRVKTKPYSRKIMAGAYLAEIEKRHAEVMEHLRCHASEPVPAEAA